MLQKSCDEKTGKIYRKGPYQSGKRRNLCLAWNVRGASKTPIRAPVTWLTNIALGEVRVR